MNLREGRPEDRATVERLSRTSFDRVYAFFAIRGIRGAWPFLLAEEAGAAVGFLEGRLYEGEPPIGYVYFVAVDSAQRRKGIARRLLEDALAAFRARGVTRVFASVPGGNEASLALFGSFGFQRTPPGSLRRWYGWRGVKVQMQMLIAPHEVLLARTFTDPSPASGQEVPRP